MGLKELLNPITKSLASLLGQPESIDKIGNILGVANSTPTGFVERGKSMNFPTTSDKLASSTEISKQEATKGMYGFMPQQQAQLDYQPVGKGLYEGIMSETPAQRVANYALPVGGLAVGALGVLGGLKDVSKVKKPLSILNKADDIVKAKQSGQFFDEWVKGRVITEESVIPKDGEPFEFSYIRNTEKSPQRGSRFGQDIEPVGKYMTVGKLRDTSILNMETGNIRLDSPLVIDFGGGYGESTNWKNVLSKKFDGKTGRDLSLAIQEAGYDGIVTVSKSGNNKYTSEIIALNAKSIKTQSQLKAVGEKIK